MKRSFRLGILVIFILITTGYSFGQAEKYQAIYMYNFTKFVKWPEYKTYGNFIIGVVGETPLKAELEKIASVKKVGDKSIEVIVVTDEKTAKKCNIMFVSSADALSTYQTISKQKNVLLISNFDGGTAKGSIINFALVNGQQKFELNQANLKEHGLTAAPALLNLAILK